MFHLSGIFTTDLALKIVCSELGTVSHKWIQIGVQLGIPHHVLKKFEKEDDPLSSTINEWMKGNARDSGIPVSWKSIVSALKDPTVEERGLAETLSIRYSQPPDAKDEG